MNDVDVVWTDRILFPLHTSSDVPGIGLDLFSTNVFIITKY